MSTALMTPPQWAQSQFTSAKLGDRRRTQRLVKIATHLAQSPGGTLPQAFPEWSDLKAAYRFFNQPKISFQEIQRPHWERTRAACQEPGQYLLIEDTSELDYTDHPMTEELGCIGDGRGRGLLLHTTLAMRIEGWDWEERPQAVALGLLSQQCWSRWGRPKRKGRETRRQLMSRSRESQRWAATLEEGGPPQGSTWIYVADRESDFYEPIERCQRQGVDFVIRGFHDRVLSQGNGHLKVEIAKAPVRGRLSIEVRARAGRAARTAQIEVRTLALNLNGPRRADLAAVRHLDPSAANHWDLYPALVRGGISQGPQERGGGRGQSNGAGLPDRVAGGRTGRSGCASVQYQVAGANPTRRAGQSENLWPRTADVAGSQIWQTPRWLDSSDRAGSRG